MDRFIFESWGYLIIPDVLVTQVGRGPRAGFRVQLNPDVMPRLRVHDVYAGALKAHRGEGHQALQQRLQEARWFIKNIQQRFDTILRVSNAIVERQKSFFVHGELAMRPLVLREIADDWAAVLHSRVTSQYYRRSYGTFSSNAWPAPEYRTSGNASRHGSAGADHSSFSREAGKPLSDSQISSCSRSRDQCARRASPNAAAADRASQPAERTLMELRLFRTARRHGDPWPTRSRQNWAKQRRAANSPRRRSSGRLAQVVQLNLPADWPNACW
jgi:RNA polymerase sigma-54 factor